MTQEQSAPLVVLAEKATFWFVWTKTGRVPHFTHKTYEAAVREATRLARKHPTKKFIVLQAVSKFSVVGEWHDRDEPASEPMLQLEESDGFGKPYVPVGKPFRASDKPKWDRCPGKNA